MENRFQVKAHVAMAYQVNASMTPAQSFSNYIPTHSNHNETQNVNIIAFFRLLRAREACDTLRSLVAGTFVAPRAVLKSQLAVLLN